MALTLRSDLFHPGQRIGVAVSGGADSVALLRALLEERHKLGIVLSVVHVGHGEHDAKLAAFLDQAAKQGHGVRAPGDRGGDPLAGMHEIGSKNWRLHRCAYVKAVSQLA